MTEVSLPILVVDLNYYRRNRIIECFARQKIECTPEQAGQLLQLVKLPDDTEEDNARLWPQLKNFFVLEPTAVSKEMADDQLRELQERYKASSGEERLQVERLMLNATDGMQEHPEWFDGACLCDLCKSYE